MSEGQKKRRRDLAPVELDRLPPHSIEAEQGVLGCVLTDPVTCMGACMEAIRGNAAVFYDGRHQVIFNVCKELYEANEGLDLITVQARLAKRETLEQVGGIAYLSELQDKVMSTANLPAYLGILREKFLLRQTVRACSEIVMRIYDAESDTPAESLLLEASAQISALTETETPAKEQSIKQIMSTVIQDMDDWHYQRGSQQLRGLATGVDGCYLDKVLTGIRETHFVVLAGRPGDGKSAKALNIVQQVAEFQPWYEAGTEEAAKDWEAKGEKVLRTDDGKIKLKRHGVPVMVFSIEMDNESLGYRLLFGRAGVSEAKFNQGYSEKGDTERLVKAAGDLAKLPIYIDDTPAASINEIAAKARRCAKQYGIKLFVLDYLQLAQSDDPNDEARVRVNKISKKIMALKKELKVPWLVLAQLNRNIETAERDRPPVLSDLAESGSIEQDADKVLILKKTPRRDLEQPKDMGDGRMLSDNEVLDQVCGDWEWSRRPRRVDVWVVKNRRGPTGKAEELFQGNLCQFEDWHLFKVKHGIEARKEGESKKLEGPDKLL